VQILEVSQPGIWDTCGIGSSLSKTDTIGTVTAPVSLSPARHEQVAVKIAPLVPPHTVHVREKRVGRWIRRRTCPRRPHGTVSMRARAGDLPEKSVPLLVIARDNARRLARLVDDILDLSGFESGNIGFNMQTMELEPLIDSAIQANRPYAGELDVELAFDNRIPSVHVEVDVGRLAQLMANLLSNAAKFSPPRDRVTVSMSLRDDWTRISIADNGPGIPESAHETLFDRFTQVDSSTTRGHGGTGLGLAIAKTIVERLHGRIGLTSDVGVGTTFFVELPARG
jgi:signal transduction histidine kinase